LGLLAHFAGKIHTFEGNLPVFMIYNLVGLGSLAAMLWLASETGKLGDQLHVVLIAGLAFAVVPPSTCTCPSPRPRTRP
jgi:hypothetical protein